MSTPNRGHRAQYRYTILESAQVNVAEVDGREVLAARDVFSATSNPSYKPASRP
jgi:hypothetical protein